MDGKIKKRITKGVIVVIAAFSIIGWSGNPFIKQCTPPPPVVSPYGGITEANQIAAYLRSMQMFGPGQWGSYPGDPRSYTGGQYGRADGMHMSYNGCVTWMEADGNIYLTYDTAAEDACDTYHPVVLWEQGGWREPGT